MLLPLGVRLCLRPAARAADPPGRRTVTALAVAAGVAGGVCGLAGGFLGARLRPRLPERVLRVVLGVLAIAAAVFYVAGALR